MVRRLDVPPFPSREAAWVKRDALAARHPKQRFYIACTAVGWVIGYEAAP